MAEKNKGKMVEAITPMSEDFTQWYTDVVLRAELIDYASVRGCMILRPYGYPFDVKRGFVNVQGHDLTYPCVLCG